jgi:integrase
MNAAIRLTNILDRLTDLLPLTRNQLEGMTAKQLRDDIAKTLGITKAYQLKKAQLVNLCWSELENVRNRLAVDKQKAEQGREALLNLKRNDNYVIPITEVATKAYGRLREIAQTGSDLASMKESINGVVAGVARSEMREHELSTAIKTRRAEIKKAIQAMVDNEIPLLKETMEVLFNYFYAQLLAFQKEDSIEFSKTYRKSVKTGNREKNPIKIIQLVEDCKETLDDLIAGENPHWTKVSIAVALGTGRRMAEIHALGKFQVTGDFELRFSGQAKTRGAEGAKNNFNIPTLFSTSQLLAAIDYLESQGKRLEASEQLKDRNATNRAYGMALSRAMEKYSGINYKGLRAIYAECQWGLLPESEKLRTEKHIKYSDWLGHIDKEGSQDATFMSYMVYQIEDFETIKIYLRKIN